MSSGVSRSCSQLKSSENLTRASLPRTWDGIRRSIIGIGLASQFAIGMQEKASALSLGKRGKESKLFFVNLNKNASSSIQQEEIDLNAYTVTSELCLLKLLPIKNAVFRGLERTVVGVSTLKNAQDAATWTKAQEAIVEAIETVDTTRGRLEPVFNPEEDTMIQIIKGERGEQLIEAFRTRLDELANATAVQNATRTFRAQKLALLALADVGEFLVPAFPYDVPSEGQYSYLPRLLGRAKVTFAIRRKKKMIGNITIIADGFAAPITAGNFVDLSIRNFYTGLPVKLTRKKVGNENEFEVATLPVLGSFQEGFYDPLSAKLRRIPLEIIRLEKGMGPKLSYAEDDAGASSSRWDFFDTPASVTKESGKSLLSFNIPGLVALNHPDKNLNGGSSEFFALQAESLPENKRALLDGEYAPFGYIVQGYNIFLSLLPGDVIESTHVDELGQLKLVKLRQSSFSEVIQSSEQSEQSKKPNTATSQQQQGEKD